MSLIQKKLLAVLVSLAIIAVATLLLVPKAGANPSFFIVGQATATATTTLTFMTAGTATTTVVQTATNNGNTMGLNAATLLVQFTGSSTASSLNLTFEYANSDAGVDCSVTPTACDWYKDGLLGAAAVVSTTTQALNLGTVANYTLPFASTTVGGLIGIATRTTRIINVQTPAQYVRAVFTLPIGSLNGGLYAKFLPTKERPE